MPAGLSPAGILPGMEPLRLLLIDDHIAEILLVEAMLEGSAEPVELTSIRTGGAALAYLEGSASLPHLIVLDLNLPGMSGLEVLRALRASVRWHDLPVIIRSGSQNPVDRQSAADAGASGYLTKPALFEALEAQLRELLGQWQHLRSGTQRAQLATAG